MDNFNSSNTSNYDFTEDPMGSIGGSSGAGDFQKMIMEEQQRGLIQQAIAKITSIAWDKCMTSRPDTSLSNREQQCISNITNTYLDSSVFVMSRLTRTAGRKEY